jgi:hypothetical protein
MATATLLCGCTANGLPAASIGGTIRLAGTGEAWPAQYASFNHPAIASAVPFSKKLWDAGMKPSNSHCLFLDPKGEPNRLTYLSLLTAKQGPRIPGLFGGRVPLDALRRASGNTSVAYGILVEFILSQSNGDVHTMRTVLQDMLNHDADCLRRELRMISTTLDLLRQNNHMTWDEHGRSIVLSNVNPKVAAVLTGKLRPLLDNQKTTLSTLPTAYSELAATLTRRIASGNVVAAAPVEQRRLPTPLPSIPKAEPSPKVTKQVMRPSPSARITVDTEPLRKADQELSAVFAKLKETCLHKASLNCA